MGWPATGIPSDWAVPLTNTTSAGVGPGSEWAHGLPSAPASGGLLPQLGSDAMNLPVEPLKQ